MRTLSTHFCPAIQPEEETMTDTTPPAAKPRSLPVDSLRPMEETQVRAVAVSVEHVDSMIPFLSDLPPIEVIRLNGGYGIVSGYHRVEAHRRAGKPRIKAVIVDIPIEHLTAYATRSNIAHGLRLTLAERRRVADRLLDAGDRRSDRAIAADCGLDGKTVGKVREQRYERECVAREEHQVTQRATQAARDWLHGRRAEELADESVAVDDPTEEFPQLRVGRDGKARRMPTTSAKATVTKPDLGGGVSHPARFSDAILDQLAAILIRHDAGARIVDPFAGTGRIHELNAVLRPNQPLEIHGVEMEREWAAMHPNTKVGNALDLPYPDEHFDACVTSPCYGNRLADHHDAADPETRRSYRFDLGRPLSPDNAGALQWGADYREFHQRAWKEAARVLRPGGLFVLNIKDHTRDGQRRYVAGWHVTTLCRLGFALLEHVEVATPALRVGDNADARWPEQVYVLRLGGSDDDR
jgi:hypothetical protein